MRIRTTTEPGASPLSGHDENSIASITATTVTVTSLLPGGTAVQVYGGMRVSDHGLGADLASSATTTVTLSTLRHLATHGHVIDKVTL
jgi:hypothetical protein